MHHKRGRVGVSARAPWIVALLRRPIQAAPGWSQWAPAYAIGALAMFWTLQRVTALG